MAGIFNLVYVMVLFLSLVIAIINVDGKHLFKLLINLIYTMFHFFYTNIALYLFHITASRKCDTDEDCPNYLCSDPKIGKCIYNNCYCI